MSAPPPINIAGTVNPYAVLKRAALGDLEAQRHLADAACAVAFDPGYCPERVLCEGLVFARMAAAQGDVADEGRLLSMLAVYSEVVGGDDEGDAEAIARVALLDEAGEPIAEAGLPAMIAEASPHVIAGAKQIKRMIEGAV